MKDLLTLIKDYLNQKDTDFAILINGQWGSGKTYFWKNDVTPNLKNIDCPFVKGKDGKLEKYDTAYISLFGLTSIDDLNQKLYSAYYPILSNKAYVAVKEIINRGAAFFKMKGLDKGEENSLVEFFFNKPKNKVVCFDDIERLDSKLLSQVLGFVNQLTEHENLKVILLCDEMVLEQKAKDDYQKIKEKLIRFTFHFKPDIDTTLPNFLSAYGSPEFTKFILLHRDLIGNAFHNGEHNNMRTLKFILDLFKKVFDAVKDSAGVNKEDWESIQCRLLLFLTSYSIEYKKVSNKALLDKTKDINSDWLLQEDLLERMLAPAGTYDEKKVEEKPEEEKFIQDFKNNYLNIEGYRFFKYFQSISDYIHTGYLDKDCFEKELIGLQGEIDKEKVSREQYLVNQLNQGLLLDDGVYHKCLDETIDKMRNGEFAIQSYPTLIGILLNVERSGLYDFKLSEELMAQISLGMNESLKISLYDERFSYYGTMIRDEDKRFNETLKLAQTLNDSIEENTLKATAPDLIDAIKKNDLDRIKEILTGDVSVQTPFLHYLSGKDVMEAIEGAENKTKHHFDLCLQRRYPHKYIHETLISEYVFVEELNHLLKEHIAKINPANIDKLNLIGIQKNTEMFMTPRK